MDVLHRSQEDSGISSVLLWFKAMQHRKSSDRMDPAIATERISLCQLVGPHPSFM